MITPYSTCFLGMPRHMHYPTQSDARPRRNSVGNRKLCRKADHGHTRRGARCNLEMGPAGSSSVNAWPILTAS